MSRSSRTPSDKDGTIFSQPSVWGWALLTIIIIVIMPRIYDTRTAVCTLAELSLCVEQNCELIVY